MSSEIESLFLQRIQQYMDQWRLGCASHNLSIMSIYDALIICCFDLVLELQLIDVDQYNEYLSDYRTMKDLYRTTILESDGGNDYESVRWPTDSWY